MPDFIKGLGVGAGIVHFLSRGPGAGGHHEHPPDDVGEVFGVPSDGALAMGLISHEKLDNSD